MPLPTTLRAVVARAYASDFEQLGLVERPMPTPGPGELLIRMSAAAINPSDFYFAQGTYGVRKPLPAPCGFEGAGIVVAAGPGVDPGWVGKRVAGLAASANSGTWADYFLADAALAVEAPETLSDAQAASLIINPFTAVALLDKAQGCGAKAIAQTAAGSALGGMIARLAAERGLAVIDVVRRADQAAALRAAGREALCEADPSFDAALAEACKARGATVALDAVGGPLTGRIARALRPGGRIIVYGGLAGAPVSIDPGLLIFRGLQVEGFWLSTWLPMQSPATLAALARQAPAFVPEVRATFPLPRYREALDAYRGQMSGGKVAIVSAP